MSRLNRFLLFLVIGAFIAVSALWIMGGKKNEYSTSVVINAHPEQVFPYLTKPDRLTQWVSGLTKVDEIMPPPEGYDPKPHMKRTFTDELGKQSNYNDVVIRFTEMELVSVQSSNSNEVVTSIYQLEPKDAGKTLLTYKIKASAVGLGRLLSPLKKTNVQDQIIDDARRLKELVEKNEPVWTGERKDGTSYQVPNFGDQLDQPAGLSLEDSPLIADDSPTKLH